MDLTKRIKILGIFFSLVAVVIFSASIPAFAVGPDWWEILAKAAPDECFYGVGKENQYPLNDACIDGQLKRNEAYVWGLTHFGDNLFFGTGANIHCLVIRGYLGQEDPIETEDYVCEMGENPMGDNRPPSLYIFNVSTKVLTKLESGPLVNVTGGIRSAGAHPDGIVLLAGPGYGQINFFAYNGNTGAFLDSGSLPGYSNIRKWLVGSDGNLYLGVGMGEGGTGSGAVLKWTGNESELFTFETVGVGLDGDAAELAEHNGRLYVTTWPNVRAIPPKISGLWMSPKLPLEADNASQWNKLWQSSSYDPDPLTALTYGGGGLASFDGWLYWGTMHVPGTAAFAHINQFGPPESQDELVDLMIGTWRSISIFRGRGFESGTPEIQLLYGGSPLRVETPSLLNLLNPPVFPPGYFRAYNPTTGNWETKQNLMGLTPLYGRGGFNNHYNNYCWTMQVYHGELYVGTMDHSYLLKDLLEDEPDISYFLGDENYGADLFKFNNANSAAVAVSPDGMDNIMNYGIRTMITNATHLFLGTANPMNLNPQGGWELIKLDTPLTRTPLVTGLSHDGARMLIGQADLDHDPEHHITYVCSDIVDRQVISQKPAAGNIVNPGNTVYLTVTATVDGSCPIIPACVGMEKGSAEKAIGDAGLSVGMVSYKCHNMDMGTVISQTPTAGGTAMPGSSVNLVVSEGQCTPAPGSGVGGDGGGGNDNGGNDAPVPNPGQDGNNDNQNPDESGNDNDEQVVDNDEQVADNPEGDDEEDSDEPENDDDEEELESPEEDTGSENSKKRSSGGCFIETLK